MRDAEGTACSSFCYFGVYRDETFWFLNKIHCCSFKTANSINQLELKKWILCKFCGDVLYELCGRRWCYKDVVWYV